MEFQVKFWRFAAVRAYQAILETNLGVTLNSLALSKYQSSRSIV